MNNNQIVNALFDAVQNNNLDIAGADKKFYTRLVLHAAEIRDLYTQLYANHPEFSTNFTRLIEVLISAHLSRPAELKERDYKKNENWFLSNELAGMSLYVDRFSGNLAALPEKLDYLLDLGVNFLHFMPIFQSPENESDGGYAVSDFRKVDKRFGSLNDLKKVRKTMHDKGVYLMLDIVLNHTSNRHEWAEKAKKGDPAYLDYYYCFDDRSVPDQYEQSMPEIFPESAPGNFTWVEECQKWIMTVFHQYQWDLNYSNPRVFVEMLDNVLFYANLGVDVLRMDAPSFLWKQIGTTSQNLPQAHTILQLLKQCVQVTAPGMAILGEAIVSPGASMKYFGEGRYLAKECDFAYNATQMALQWDALATGQVSIMMAAQPVLAEKPFGTSWITYTRCHDDIGLGYDDYTIREAGYDPFEHRKFLKDYFTGQFPGSVSTGALFSVNSKTQDARISGTLASLCGLEKGISEKNEHQIGLAIRKIILMQANSFFLGGVPMLFYGDEAAYLNDYSFLDTPGKNYDNRWMHRPIIDWQKNELTGKTGTIENRVFTATKRLLEIRKKLPVVADLKNIRWIPRHNIHVAGFVRNGKEKALYCIFNYSQESAYLTWHTFRYNGLSPEKLYDHWRQEYFQVGTDADYLILEPYGFYLLEVTE
jgi:amylosucrase